MHGLLGSMEKSIRRTTTMYVGHGAGGFLCHISSLGPENFRRRGLVQAEVKTVPDRSADTWPVEVIHEKSRCLLISLYSYR